MIYGERVFKCRFLHTLHFYRMDLFSCEARINQRRKTPEGKSAEKLLKATEQHRGRKQGYKLHTTHYTHTSTMVVLAALHIGWLKFLAVFLTKKKQKTTKNTWTWKKRYYNKQQIGKYSKYTKMSTINSLKWSSEFTGKHCSLVDKAVTTAYSYHTG